MPVYMAKIINVASQFTELANWCLEPGKKKKERKLN